MASKRIIWLDFARGLAALGVMYDHVLPWYVGVGKWIYTWHIPIFFIISGILLEVKDDWRSKTYKELFVKDMKHLMYPYLVFNIIETVIMSFMFPVKDVLVGVFHFCILDGLQVLWFLSALLVARIVFFQLMKRTDRKAVMMTIIVAVMVVTSVFSLMGPWAKSSDGLIMKIYGFVNIFNRSLIGFVFLEIGFHGARILKKYQPGNSLKWSSFVVSLILGILFYSCNMVDIRFSKIGNPFLFYVMALAGSIVIFIISEYAVRIRWLSSIQYMGVHSIVFMITHIPIRTLLAVCFPAIDHDNKYLFFMILLISEFAVVWVISRYLPWLYHWKWGNSNKQVAGVV